MAEDQTTKLENRLRILQGFLRDQSLVLMTKARRLQGLQHTCSEVASSLESAANEIDQLLKPKECNCETGKVGN